MISWRGGIHEYYSGNQSNNQIVYTTSSQNTNHHLTYTSSFLFHTDFSLKMSNNRTGSEKCNWDNEGSVFFIKWYNGKDSHG
jgi:hypothetical protein